MVVYIDGVQAATTTAGSPTYFATWQRGVVLGAIRTIANRAVFGDFYKGLMDDLRVYNYAMDKYGIADIYNDGSGKGACIETYASIYDFDKNCKVDLGDLSILATNWLSCGLYPISTCQQ